jgi:hypothetical protein
VSYTLGRSIIRFAIGVVFLIVIFGRIDTYWKRYFFEFTGTIILKNLGFLFYTFDNSILP